MIILLTKSFSTFPTFSTLSPIPPVVPHVKVSVSTWSPLCVRFVQLLSDSEYCPETFWRGYKWERIYPSLLPQTCCRTFPTSPRINWPENVQVRSSGNTTGKCLDLERQRESRAFGSNGRRRCWCDVSNVICAVSTWASDLDNLLLRYSYVKKKPRKYPDPILRRSFLKSAYIMLSEYIWAK